MTDLPTGNGGAERASDGTVPASVRSTRRRRSVQPSASEPEKSREKAPYRFALALVGAALLLLLTLLGPIMTFDAPVNEGGGSLLRQAGYLAIAVMAALALHAEALPRRLLVIPWPLVIALAWCWLSVTWAIAPGIATRRVVLTTLIVFSVFALMRSLGHERFLTLIRVVLVVALIANYLTVYFAPHLGIHQTEIAGDDGLTGDWRGLMAHKNVAGLVSALTIIYFIFDADKVPKALRVAVAAAAGGFLFLSSSRTSVGVCLGALVVGLLFLVYRFRYRQLAFAFLFLLIAAGAIVQNVYSDPFLRTLNDPTAFTGRTVIWAVLWSYAGNNPWLGAGFGSFWNIGPASPIFQYGRDWLLGVTQAHNGYLDLLIQIGPIGLALVMIAVIAIPVVQLLNSRQTQGQSGALLMASLIFSIGHNMTESSLLDRDSIGNVFWMLTLALLWSETKSKGAATSSRNLLSWANQSFDEARPSRQKSRRRRSTDRP